MLVVLLALSVAVVGVALLAEFGEVISLESRKGLVEMGLTDLLSETRFRKGFLEAREAPRSAELISIMLAG